MNHVMLHSVTTVHQMAIQNSRTVLLVYTSKVIHYFWANIKRNYFKTQDCEAADLCITRKKSLLYCCCWYCWYCYYHHHNHQHYNHHKHQKKQQKRLLLPLLLMLPLPQPLPKLLLLILLVVNYNNELNLHHQHEWEFYCSKAGDVVILDGTGKGSGICKWQRTVHW